jgi:peptide/nickel transport system substrate-binding protein
LTKKIVWLVVSCLMVLSLIMASCGNAPTETTTTTTTTKTTTTTTETTTTPTETTTTTTPEAETSGVLTGGGENLPTAPETMVTLTLEKMDGTTITKTKELPKYGGTVTKAITADYQCMDPMLCQAVRVGHIRCTYNELLQGNWLWCHPGTDDVYTTQWTGRFDLETGELAESWEMPDDETIIFHIRKGVHFWNKPPVNGRELTADDVAWSLQYQCTVPTAWQAIGFSKDKLPYSFKALDKYTVELKVPPKWQGTMLIEMGDNAHISPVEMGTEAGAIGSDWTKVVGSGPFMLVDYVGGSSATYAKNPDYFESSPIYPDQKLPYVDTYKQLIIADVSTQQAAFRTGKIDTLPNNTYDQAQLFIKENPQLKYGRIAIMWPFYLPGFRIDKPELPFYDIRVRQAMNMAVNKQAIIDEYYKGDAQMIGYPFPDAPGYETYYTKLEDMPENVQMLYRYDPEKAKELLAEAGYPDGFKTFCVTSNTTAAVDILSIIQADLAKVDIDMEIQALEPSVYRNIWSNRAIEEMGYCYAAGSPTEHTATRPTGIENFVHINDPYFADVEEQVSAYFVNDPPRFQKAVKDMMVYSLGLTWAIWMPRPWSWHFWWPWLKDYDGITDYGWDDSDDVFKYVWIDQDLKKAMGY